MHADPVGMETLGGVRDRAETENYFRRNLAHWNDYGFGIYALRESRTRRFLGRAGLRWTAIEGVDELEVAYALVPDAWGYGLATAICVELVAKASAAELAEHLVALTLTTNHGSERVMQKAGFLREREFVHAGRPHVLYRRSLLA